MQIPQIRIQSQNAIIQIDQKDAKLEIQQPKAELSIGQPQADLTIRTTPGKLTIDQSQAWADLNLKSIFQLNKEFSQAGIRESQEGTARRAREGSELMRIENGGNPLVSQAKNRTFSSRKSLGITFIPSHFSVKTHYQPAEVKIDIQANKPIIEAKPNQPIINYQKGDINISLKQRPEIKIDFVNITV